jgi:predicted glycosyltransferase
MRIVVDINHPAHVHYSKNFIRQMRERGHQILITATEKDIACALLDRYNLEYSKLGSYGSSLISKVISFPLINMRMFLAVRKFEPDIFLGFGSIRAAHVAYLLRKPCINFEDTEHSSGQIRLYLPFVSAVCTPTCFNGDLGPKHIRFNSYMELASLHPNHFTPNPAVLDEMGLNPDDPFIILRFVSWQASHDVGQHGIRDKVGLVKALEPYGRILITSEGSLQPELQPYQIRVSPEKLHDLLYYAILYVGEGGTTASEAAVLGTHAIHISSTAKYCGTFCDLNRYGLLWTSESDDDTIKKAIELLQRFDLKDLGHAKRDILNNEKIDLTAFMHWFVEDYPESAGIMRANPDFQNRFRMGSSL